MDRSRMGLIAAVVVFVGAMLAVIVYSSIGIHPYEVETCITYNGRTNCGTAAGATTVLFAAEGSRREAAEQADHVIHDLSELITILNNGESR